MPVRGSSRRAVAVAIACSLALAASGCGARWTAEQATEVQTRGAAGSSTGATGSGAGSGGGGTAATASSTPGGSSGATATTVAGSAAGSASGDATGTAGSAAGDGGVQPAASQGPLPCAAPSDAIGVTADTITVGDISTITGPAPGIGSTSLAAAGAYVAYRNSLGGVCGRQIVLNTADDGADNSRYRSLVTELSGQVFGFSGGFAAGDAGGADILASQGVPVVATAFTDEFQNSSTVFDINPSPADPNAPVGKFQFLHDQGVSKAALVYLAQGAARLQVLLQRAQMEASGIQVVNVQELPLSTLSFDSAARGVVNSGADYLFFVGAETQTAAMAQALIDAGANLTFVEYITAYGSNFIDLAGAAAEGSTQWIRSLPAESAGGNAEQATYVQWMAQTAPNDRTDTFAADSWASSKAFFDALEALPGPITREAMIAQLRSMTTFDAGGLMGPIDLGDKVSNSCQIGMVVHGGVWERLTPADGFLC